MAASTRFRLVQNSLFDDTLVVLDKQEKVFLKCIASYNGNNVAYDKIKREFEVGKALQGILPIPSYELVECDIAYLKQYFGTDMKLEVEMDGCANILRFDIFDPTDTENDYNRAENIDDYKCRMLKSTAIEGKSLREYVKNCSYNDFRNVFNQLFEIFIRVKGRFTHNDLHMDNIIVDSTNKIFLIDLDRSFCIAGKKDINGEQEYVKDEKNNNNIMENGDTGEQAYVKTDEHNNIMENDFTEPNFGMVNQYFWVHDIFQLIFSILAQLNLFQARTWMKQFEEKWYDVAVQDLASYLLQRYNVSQNEIDIEIQKIISVGFKPKSVNVFRSLYATYFNKFTIKRIVYTELSVFVHHSSEDNLLECLLQSDNTKNLTPAQTEISKYLYTLLEKFNLEADDFTYFHQCIKPKEKFLQMDIEQLTILYQLRSTPIKKPTNNQYN